MQETPSKPQFGLKALLATVAVLAAVSWIAKVGYFDRVAARRFAEEISLRPTNCSSYYTKATLSPTSGILNLCGKGVTDDELRRLHPIIGDFSDIDLSSNSLTSKGVREGIPLNKKLTQLWLNDTDITNPGLEHLGKITSLRELMLLDNSIDSRGVDFLSSLVNLERLGLSRTSIDDAGLYALRMNKNLKWIHLGGTQITSEGLGAWLRTKTDTERYGLAVDLTDFSSDPASTLFSLEEVRELAREFPEVVFETTLGKIQATP